MRLTARIAGICLGIGALALSGTDLGAQGQPRLLSRPMNGQPLVLGQTVEREIRGLDQHNYEIDLIPGQFVKLRLLLEGTENVTARFFEPTGRPIPSAFSETRPYGPGLAYFEATIPGAYRLLITPVRAPDGADKYKLTWEISRPATPEDKAVMEVSREWFALQSEVTQTIIRQDWPALRASYSRFLKQGEKLDKDDGLYALYDSFSSTFSKRLADAGQVGMAESLLTETLESFDRVQGPENLESAQMLAVIGDFYQSQKRSDDAIPFMRRLGVMLVRDHSGWPPSILATLLQRAGEFYENQRTYELALQPLRQSLQLFKTAPGIATRDVLVARLEYDLGIALLQLGSVAEAKPLIESSSTEFEKRVLTAAALQNRFYSLVRLRYIERVGVSEGWRVTLDPGWIVREALPELTKIARSSVAEHKAWLKEMLEQTPDHPNKKTLDTLLKENP